MKHTKHSENLTSNERAARFAISAIAVIAAMESSLVGTPMFAAINIVAIALATTAIVGWDPLKAIFTSSKQANSTQYVVPSDQRA